MYVPKRTLDFDGVISWRGKNSWIKEAARWYSESRDVNSFGLDDSGVLRVLVKDLLKVYSRITKQSFGIDSEVAPRNSVERHYVFFWFLRAHEISKNNLDPIYLQATFKEWSHNVIYGFKFSPNRLI